MTYPKSRIQEKWDICCMSCGHAGSKFVTLNERNLPPQITACPKCSNEAFVLSIGCLGVFMSRVCKQIAQINLDMIDLQDDGEER